MSQNETKPCTPTAAMLRQRYIEATTRPSASLNEVEERGQEFDRGIEQIIVDADKPAPCRMTHTEPFDFAQCNTHDKTFALGDTCPWDGVESITDKLQDGVDEQRRLKVRAQFELEQLQVRLAGHVPVACARCGNKPVLVPETDPDNLMDMRVCWDCEVIVGQQMRQDHEEATATLRSELADASAALAQVRAATDTPDEVTRLRLENERLKQEARDAHNTLVSACIELGWATDGRLPTAVRHAGEMIRRLRANRESGSVG